MITRHSELLSLFSTPLDNVSDLNKDLRPVPQKLASTEYGRISSQQRLQKMAINNRNLQTLAQQHTFAVNKHKTNKQKILKYPIRCKIQRYS